MKLELIFKSGKILDPLLDNVEKKSIVRYIFVLKFTDIIFKARRQT